MCNDEEKRVKADVEGMESM
jgi:hypothetical protein